LPATSASTASTRLSTAIVISSIRRSGILRICLRPIGKQKTSQDQGRDRASGNARKPSNIVEKKDPAGSRSDDLVSALQLTWFTQVHHLRRVRRADVLELAGFRVAEAGRRRGKPGLEIFGGLAHPAGHDRRRHQADRGPAEPLLLLSSFCFSAEWLGASSSRPCLRRAWERLGRRSRRRAVTVDEVL